MKMMETGGCWVDEAVGAWHGKVSRGPCGAGSSKGSGRGSGTGRGFLWWSGVDVCLFHLSLGRC